VLFRICLAVTLPVCESGDSVDKIDKYDWAEGVDTVKYQSFYLIITHCFNKSSGPHVDIVVIIIVVVVVIVIVVVVIVQVIFVGYSYHCHKYGRQECKQAEYVENIIVAFLLVAVSPLHASCVSRVSKNPSPVDDFTGALSWE